MTRLLRCPAGLAALSIAAIAMLLLSAASGASQDKQGDKKKERDVFDYEAQKAAKDVKRIVIVADTAPHGKRGNHEFFPAAIYFARLINQHYPNAYVVVHPFSKWPTDLKHADSIIVILNHGGSAVNAAVKEAVDGRNAGFMAVHWGVEVDKGEQAQHFTRWIGGYFEPFFSVNPVWVGEFKEIPKHDITRGVKPFTIRDEWYYHMRFVDKMKGVTPILTGHPTLKTLTGDPNKPTMRGNNPTVYESVKAGNPQVVAWTYDRPNGGRGFGFSGLHFHENLGNDEFRKLLLNSVAWVSKLPVPEDGVPSEKLSRLDLEQLIDDGKLAMKRLGVK